MRYRRDKLGYIATTALFVCLTILSFGVAVTSLGKNAIDMCVRIGFDWRYTGNYVGLITGFAAYGLFALTLTVLRMRHNLDWFMKFTHELSHTLVALTFLCKIHEFVVKGRDCHVYHARPRIGYLSTYLAPYCIPIYTFMLFPFRFAGDDTYMIVFDVLIAFTYAFHIHSYIRQTRLTQSDIENCGKARSVAFISFMHFTVLSLILAIPKGGVLKAFTRVFCDYPEQIICDPSGWLQEIIKYF